MCCSWAFLGEKNSISFYWIEGKEHLIPLQLCVQHSDKVRLFQSEKINCTVRYKCFKMVLCVVGLFFCLFAALSDPCAIEKIETSCLILFLLRAILSPMGLGVCLLPRIKNLILKPFLFLLWRECKSLEVATSLCMILWKCRSAEMLHVGIIYFI